MIYFNEFEPFAAQWLTNLFPDATVDERSIKAGRSRVGRLKGYGNAIVPQVAAVFIRSFLELIGGAK